eukprot:1241099-Prymnesium_polylepis.1
MHWSQGLDWSFGATTEHSSATNAASPPKISRAGVVEPSRRGTCSSTSTSTLEKGEGNAHRVLLPHRRR